MIKNHINLRPARPEDTPILRGMALEDQHGVAPPAFVVEKDGEITGYFHISPAVLAWLSTKRMMVRDTLQAINAVENFLAMNGSTCVQFPVPVESPMHSEMESLGFKSVGTYTLFTKGIV